MKTLLTSPEWLRGLSRITRRSVQVAGLFALLSTTSFASDLVLVVDTSGSMNEPVSATDKRIRIEVVQRALRDYLPALPPSSRIHLIAFNSRIVSEKEFILSDAVGRAGALAWVEELKGYAASGETTHLWTTLRRALVIATDFSTKHPGETVVVRVLTDGVDNEKVTSFDAVLKEFPLVDGEHIRGNLVLLGDFEFKTKLKLPEGALEPTRSIHWVDLFPPVILMIPAHVKVGEEVRFVENTKSIYSAYQWFVDGKRVSDEKVLTWHFSETRSHRVILKVKGLDGGYQSGVFDVSAAEKPAFTVDFSPAKDAIQPGETLQFTAHPSDKALRYRWEINGTEVGSNPELVWQSSLVGIADVKVTVWDADGREASQTKPVTVVETPLALHIEGPQEATSGQSVQFAAEVSGPFASAEWDFGDGSKSSAKNPLHVFTLKTGATSEFKITLRVATATGRSFEAPAHLIRVEALTVIKPPVADFSAVEAKPRVGDEWHLVDLSRGQIEAWSWEITGEAVVQARSPVIRFTTAGNKTVRLTVRGPGGTNTVSRQFIVAPRFNPIHLDVAASVVAGTAPIRTKFLNRSTGDVQTWRWNFGDGHTSAERSPEHEYTTPGDYVARVAAISPDPTVPPSETSLALTAAAPWPTWAKCLVALLGLAALVALGWAIRRRRQKARLRLPVYYWAHDAAASQRFDLTGAGEARDLPGLHIRIRRLGASADLIAEALNGAVIILSDAQEQATQNLGAGAQLTVRLANGAKKAVAIAANQKPRCPRPPVADETLTPEPVAAAAATPEAELIWEWDKHSKS